MPHLITYQLKRIRLACGWSQTTLAQEAGIAKNTVHNIEHGKVMPTRRILHKILTAVARHPKGLRAWQECVHGS